MMLPSPDFFDRLANGGLADFHHRFRHYRREVDRVVLAYAPRHPRYLDVGCGDGERAARLAYAIQADSLTLCDNSPEMALLAWRHGPTWITPAERLSESREHHGQFDLVTCLDVLGHVRSFPAALDGLARMLAPGGVLVFDANNACNVREHGLWALSRWFAHWDRPLVLELGDEQTDFRIYTPEDVAVDHPSLRGEAVHFLDEATGVERSQWGGRVVAVSRNKGLRT